ncbi:alkylation response protein AidB-like acyl-CoA dehydrogenase [Herbihabitans rhizosphaerae]|uniref:Alkylation response protein AidB-like acyl-CoA dehydrogenase n=1 Tax=Herbihabitans rhizosphaerae TaxID=1872711 RepID=A0A4Q7KHQ2_9PSEU|nr:acyl-CoA dehydrogenase family protein [Herbihabitans rhizosphaerae]RZS32787.1 alkylation response protein AidB-like acyl-CoA dehydrogenase [Herbihabitans rhizosphaerae]
MTDLLYSDVEEDLRASVRDLLADRVDAAAILARCETGEPHDRDTWRALAEVGVTSLQVPEELGGQGASLRETAVAQEELGRAVAPVPFLGSAVLATAALLDCGADDLTRALAEGTATATLAVSLATAPGAAFPSGVSVVGGRLGGVVRAVADTSIADLLVVPAIGDGGPELHAVRVADVGVTITPSVSLDLTRPVADVELTGVASERLAGPDRAESTVDNSLLVGAGMLAAEQVGLAEWCVQSTVDYLRERHQFGRPVGSFQALKHRLADLWSSLVSARAASRYAADTLATGDPDARIAVHLAASFCSALAVRAAEECVQLHGGIGMTWEHPAHLYLKRAKANEIALGTPGTHRTRLAPLVDLPA